MESLPTLHVLWPLAKQRSHCHGKPDMHNPDKGQSMNISYIKLIHHIGTTVILPLSMLLSESGDQCAGVARVRRMVEVSTGVARPSARCPAHWPWSPHSPQPSRQPHLTMQHRLELVPSSMVLDEGQWYIDNVTDTQAAEWSVNASILISVSKSPKYLSLTLTFSSLGKSLKFPCQCYAKKILLKSIDVKLVWVMS